MFLYIARKSQFMQYKKTKKGYLRYAKDEAGKLRFEHCIIWERHNGKIPLGMQIHHIDFDKTNNKIENLLLVTPADHKKYHSNYKKNAFGEWEKMCSKCMQYKEPTADNWYFSRGWITGTICKKCFIQKSLQVRQQLIAKGWKRIK